MARFQLGTLRPLHATSPGKIFLAFAVAPKDIAHVLGPGPLVAITRFTKTDVSQVRGEIKQVRARGYAVNEQEALEGAFGVSAPVFNADGSLGGCVTLGLPEFRFRASKDVAIQKVVDAAIEISRRLGQDRWMQTLRSASEAR
jgi:IclR family acetate operon transcriptional repressor